MEERVAGPTMSVWAPLPLFGLQFGILIFALSGRPGGVAALPNGSLRSNRFANLGLTDTRGEEETATGRSNGRNCDDIDGS